MELRVATPNFVCIRSICTMTTPQYASARTHTHTRVCARACTRSVQKLFFLSPCVKNEHADYIKLCLCVHVTPNTRQTFHELSILDETYDVKSVHIQTYACQKDETTAQVHIKKHVHTWEPFTKNSIYTQHESIHPSVSASVQASILVHICIYSAVRPSIHAHMHSETHRMPTCLHRCVSKYRCACLHKCHHMHTLAQIQHD